MPHVVPLIADCSVYMYASEESADNGSNSGGSGFLVHYPSTVKGYGHLYAVTNQHIIDDGFCVLRLNRKQGDFDKIVTQPENWLSLPQGDDVAIHAIALGEDFKWWSVGTDLFINKSIIDAYKIGYGDDAFLVGRLITHAGRQKNSPALRFGNISLMADSNEPIQYTDNKGKERKQEGFLVECRSLSGFSGSPVFVMTSQEYRGDDAQKIANFQVGGGIPRDIYDGANLPRLYPGQIRAYKLQLTNAGPWFLGIDFGHIPLWNAVYKKDHKTKTEFEVESNTGIAGVIPAWRLLELLEMPKLQKDRKREDTKIAKSVAAGNGIVLDVSQEIEPTQTTTHGEDIPIPTEDQFFDDLTKASRKKD